VKELVLPVNNDTRDCSIGGTLLAFESRRGDKNDPADQTIFRLNQDGSVRFIERSFDSGVTYNRITSPEVDIEEFRIFVTNTDRRIDGNEEQPIVVMSITSSAGIGRSRTEFRVQTSVTQRVLDL